MRTRAEIKIMSEASIGDNVTFGNYKGNTEWIILAKETGKILVISKDAIEQRPYNIEYTSITWEKSVLRSWLSDTYLTSAFNSDEQTRIEYVSIENADNAECGTDGGNNTMDKVFLLSIDEANRYFHSDSVRQATLSNKVSAWWWLRSPGKTSTCAAYVNSVGTVNGNGGSVSYMNGAVRPAMWIDISDL